MEIVEMKSGDKLVESVIFIGRVFGFFGHVAGARPDKDRLNVKTTRAVWGKMKKARIGTSGYDHLRRAPRRRFTKLNFAMSVTLVLALHRSPVPNQCGGMIFHLVNRGIRDLARAGIYHQSNFARAPG